MGGLIQFNEITTPKYRGTFSGDVNSITKSGLYVLVSGHTGSPAPNSYSLLEVITSGDNYIIMRWYANGYADKRQRIKFESYDSGWYE